jgi:hypothetical protein
LWSNWWNEDWQGKPKYLEKTCPSATLSTTNPTCPDPGSNPGRRGGKPTTNRLSYGAATTILSKILIAWCRNITGLYTLSFSFIIAHLRILYIVTIYVCVTIDGIWIDEWFD